MAAVEEHIQKVESMFSPQFKESSLYKKYIKTCREEAVDDDDDDDDNWHVRATPLLDVLCVSIQSKSDDDDDGRPFEICGFVQVIDEENYTYDVYRREWGNPEIVWPGGILSLTHPDGSPSCPVLPSTAFKMQVHLRDTAQDKEMANGFFFIDLTNEVDCEGVKLEIVQGQDGFATVQYATLPYAVIANVEFRPIKEDGSGPQSHAGIYGSISASSKTRKEGNISSLLFKKPDNQPIMIDFKTPIGLSKSVLAIPAYSSLQIKADLWDHDTQQPIASDVVIAECQALDNRLVKQDSVLGQNYRVQVKVQWCHAYVQLFDQGYPKHKKLRCDQQPPSVLSNRNPHLYMGELFTQPTGKFIYGRPLVELFAVSISLDSDVNLSLCGTIKVHDTKGSLCIFQRDYNCPEFLFRDMKIGSIEWPSRPFKGTKFGMQLHLTDDEGREVCKGSFGWNISYVEVPISWHNRRISSVIRGEHGYATVHYTIYSNAVEARVKVLFIPNNSFDVPFKVKGNVVARYTCYTYSTSYEREFFQSTLLRDDHSMMLARGSPIKLQKTVVSVPTESSLILEVNLQAEPLKYDINNAKQSIQMGETSGNITLHGLPKFKIDMNNTSYGIIEGENFHVLVFVEWTQK